MKEKFPFSAKTESAVGKNKYAAVRAGWPTWLKTDLNWKL